MVRTEELQSTRAGRMSVWPVEHIPADFVSVVIGLREAETCTESEKYIVRGRAILRQLRRRRVRLPSADVMDRWNRSLKSFKKHCRRK